MTNAKNFLLENFKKHPVIYSVLSFFLANEMKTLLGKDGKKANKFCFGDVVRVRRNNFYGGIKAIVNDYKYDETLKENVYELINFNKDGFTNKHFQAKDLQYLRKVKVKKKLFKLNFGKIDYYAVAIACFLSFGISALMFGTYYSVVNGAITPLAELVCIAFTMFALFVGYQLFKETLRSR